MSEVVVAKTCKYCDKEFKFDRKNGKRRTICNSCSVVKYRQNIKKKALLYKGGKCEICGYNTCNEALEFHHKDPNQKDFGISHKGYVKSWEKVKIEIDKCVLLCANCHREVHSGLLIIK
jgi:hypothetical protein